MSLFSFESPDNSWATPGPLDSTQGYPDAGDTGDIEDDLYPEAGVDDPDEPDYSLLTELIDAAKAAQPHLFTEGIDEDNIAGRTDWEWAKYNTENPEGEIGMDPEVPGYVVRRSSYDELGEISPEEGFTALQKGINGSEAQLLRLTAGGPITIPDHFYATPVKPTQFESYLDDTGHTAFLYVEQLTVEDANPANPAHEPHLLDIGNTITTYLEKTPVGALFTNEYLRISQYSIGRPRYGRPGPDRIYIHDCDYVNDDMIVPRIANGQPQFEGENYNFFTDIVDDTRGWLRQLRASTARDTLIRRLDALHTP